MGKSVHKPNARHRPEADEGFADERTIGNEPPFAAIQTVEAVVAHDEAMTLGNQHP